MKTKMIIFALLMANTFVLFGQQKFIINGHIDGLTKPLKIQLRSLDLDGQQKIEEEITTVKGYFAFMGNTDLPMRVVISNLSVAKGASDSQVFYLESGQTRVSGTGGIKDASIKGSKVQQEYLPLQAKFKPLDDQIALLSTKRSQYKKENMEKEVAEISALVNSIRNKKDEISNAFIYEHPDSYVSLDLVRQKMIGNDLAVVEPFYKALNPKLRNSIVGKDMGNNFANNKINQAFINFKLPTKDAKEIELASFKGKYVFIDVWASWCHWCREENPNILKAYNKYKDKNFEVLGLSLDQSNESWLKALEEDGMPWLQVRDPKAFEGAIAKHYYIRAIPRSFLLNPEGIVVAKDLRGDELEGKLDELIGNKAKGFTLKVKLDNFKNYKSRLVYKQEGKYVIDTNSIIENGWTVFKGVVKEPVAASFIVQGNPALAAKSGKRTFAGPLLKLFLSNDEIILQGDANKVYMASVSGGKDNAEWQSIKSIQDSLTDQNWSIFKKVTEQFKPGDDSLVFKQVEKVNNENGIRSNQLNQDFMKAYPNSLVSMYLLSGMQNSLGLDALKTAYTALGSAYKNSSYGKEIAVKIVNMEITAIGRPAIDIRKKDISGNDISLESLKGKYVLLDFWGSWCGPCRASHPHLKNLYTKYKTAGLEIVGIASEGGTLEESRKKWTDAIKEDGINWLQVLNEEGKEQFDAVKAYGISAFPTKILLDKEGKIIARYVGDSTEIDGKLKQIFGE